MNESTLKLAIEFIIVIVGGFISYFSGYALFIKQKDRNILEELKKKVNILENKYVTEARVRELIREELLPLSKEIQEVKNTTNATHELLMKIRIEQAEERGYRRALDIEANKDRK